MLTNLNKWQIVIFILLVIFLIVLIIPIAQKEFNSKTAGEYEPWDPDNINVIKNKITQLNKEGDQINQRLSLLPSYLTNLDANARILNSTSLDSLDYLNTLNSIQPSTMFKDIIPYVEYAETDNYNLDKSDKILNDINKKILSAGNNYINVFNELLNSLSFEPVIPNLYYRSPITQRRIYSTPAKLSDSPKIVIVPAPKFQDASKKFEGAKITLAQIIKSLDSAIIYRISTDQKRSLELSTQLDKVKDDFNKRNFNINQYAVIIGIPFFIFAALLMYWYGLKASNRISPNSGAGSEDFKIGLSFTLNTITVLLLILSLLILGLAKVISENALAALLGTIGGYVLNNATDKSGATKLLGNLGGQNPTQSHSIPTTPPVTPIPSGSSIP